MKQKILIVGNSRAMQQVIEFKVNELFDFDIVVCNSFESLKNFLKKEKPFIAIAKSRMSDTNGYEVIDYLIEQDISTIVLSDKEDNMLELSKKRALDIVPRDNIEDLLEKVLNLIDRIIKNRKITILIVDDSETFRMSTTLLLLSHHFNVIEAKDGEEALEKFHKNREIKLVLIDYHMPRMNGAELTKALRLKYTKEELIIIGITADSIISNDFLHSGANDYLFKNSNIAEFFSRIYNNIDLYERYYLIQENKILLEQYKRSVDQSSIVSKTDLKGVITYVNDRFCKISGYSKEELIGAKHNIVRHPEISSAIYKEIWKTLLNQDIWRGVIKNMDKSGNTYYVDALIMPITGADGKTKEYMSIRHDITKLIEQEKQLREHLIDPLTGMPNRVKLLEDLKALHSQEKIILALIDIDGFNKINDFFGYSIGDKIISNLAQKIYAKLGETHNIYHIAADVYAVMIQENSSIHNISNEIKEFILSIEALPIQEDEKEIYLSLSAGIAQGYKESVLIFSDIALKESKNKKKRVSIFQDAFYNPTLFSTHFKYKDK